MPKSRKKRKNGKVYKPSPYTRAVSTYTPTRQEMYTSPINRVNEMHRDMLLKISREDKIKLLVSNEPEDRKIRDILRKEIATLWRQGIHYPGWSSYYPIKKAA